MNATTWTVPAAARLDAEVRRGLAVSHSVARRAISTGKIRLDATRVTDGATPVAPGQTIEYHAAAPDPRRAEPHGVRLVYRDEHLLVIDKPAGLLSAPVPGREEPTALHAAGRLARSGTPKPVHRLDEQTSGLLIFALGVPAARALRELLDAHEIRRRYRCVVAGRPEPADALLSSMLVRDAGEGRRGSRRGSLRVRPANVPDPGPMPGAGKLAVTRYWTVATGPEATALEVRLSTGRTHQIRIHLAEHGHPVLGERVYARQPGAPRQALHSATLDFIHPFTGSPLRFESPWPADLADVSPIGRDW